MQIAMASANPNELLSALVNRRGQKFGGGLVVRVAGRVGGRGIPLPYGLKRCHSQRRGPRKALWGG